MRNFSIVILSMVILGMFNSCKHNNFKDFVGPAICPTSSFAYKTQFAVSSTSIDFTAKIADTITASFTESVSWTITITGQTSGAKSIITGKSDTIGVLWQGNPTRGISDGDFRFFKTGEDVTIVLNIACLEPQTKTVHITKENDFTSTAGGITLVSGFEGNKNVYYGYVPDSTHIGYNGKGWSCYVGAGGKVDSFHIVSGPLSAPQGSHYLTFRGTPASNSWYMGDFETSTGPPGGFIDDNPDNNYFNAFINSGGNTTTALTMQLNIGTEAYLKTFIIDWTGWKAVSYKFSEFKNKNTGLPMQYTSGISDVIFATGPATAVGQSNEVNIDMVVLTTGGPFVQ